jgi:hypothetical protein
MSLQTTREHIRITTTFTEVTDVTKDRREILEAANDLFEVVKEKACLGNGIATWKQIVSTINRPGFR